MALAEPTYHTVRYGDAAIEYALAYAPRKTLGISVHPDLRVTVTAPEGSDVLVVQAKVRKRAPWILRQQRNFRRCSPDFPPRQYVSGESHWYLGRQYRLKIIESDFEVVKLSRGYLSVYVRDRNNRDTIKALLDRWYRKRARVVFEKRLDACYPKVERLGIAYPELGIRVMQSRWGSCTANGRVLLNVKLVQVPTPLIDYVIFHELCHLKEHNHGSAFYELLDRVLPTWHDLKRRLDEYEFS